MADRLLLADGVSLLLLADGASKLLLAGQTTISPADIAAIAAAVVALMNLTPPAVNVKKMNDAPVIGNGTPPNLWRGV